MTSPMAPMPVTGKAAPALLRIAIVGAGPRGTSVLERICANAKEIVPDTRVRVHVVDPFPPGPGRVWRTEQSRHLLMNTVASQVTLFTDDTVGMEGPVRPGPSLYEWAQEALRAGPSVADRRTGVPQLSPEERDQARRLGPDSYPTRAFYGRYLAWFFARTVAEAPGTVAIIRHATRAVGLEEMRPDADGMAARQVLRCADGTELRDLDAVILAQGHVATRPAVPEARLLAAAATAGLRYLPPASPADVDLGFVPPGEPVLLRGLGLSFFDHLTTLTQGRGGRFQRKAGNLRYLASGAEPRIIAGSRRGVPYHARGDNQKGPHGRHVPAMLSVAAVERLRRKSALSGGLDFERDVWPLIHREVELVHATTLVRARAGREAASRFARDYAAASAAEVPSVLTDHGLGPATRWDWGLVAAPYRNQTFTCAEDFDSWLLGRLRQDVTEARLGNVTGPVKAALDVLRDLRNEIRLVVEHGALAGESHRRHLDEWYTPLNAFLSIGPPAGRIEEMIALIEAGVLRVIGPDLRVRVDEGRRVFVARSALVPGPEVATRILVEARLHEADLGRTADPLLRSLLDAGQCRVYRRPTDLGSPYETGGLAVGARPYPLVAMDGTEHPRRFAFGVPVEGVHWVTAAGARPGVNSVTFCDSDAIARRVLAFGRPDQDLENSMSDQRGGGPAPDSGLLTPVRAGTRVEPLVDDRAWVQALLDAEAALVRAQARLGSVPAAAAETITAAAQADRFDVVTLALRSRDAANPVVALVQDLTAAVARIDPAAAEYVHRGSTSQDILDTAAMLVTARSFAVVAGQLHEMASALARLAQAHRDTPMAGRTLTQQAVPITFGLKAAGWLHLVLEAEVRVRQTLRSRLPVQLGGAAGTLAGYLQYARIDGGPGEEYPGRLIRAFAEETGLTEPVLPWHTLRMPIADVAATACAVTGALGKIAVDVQSLTRTEVAEVREPAQAGRGASSAMPQKQNPVLATMIRAAASQVPLLAAGLNQALLAEDERPAGAWHAEWGPLRECLRLTGGAAETALELVAGLEVEPGRMRANLELTGGALVAERLAAELTPALGRAPAKALLTRLSRQAGRTGRTLGEELGEASEVAGRWPGPTLDEMLDPENYLGASGVLVDRMLTRYREGSIAGALDAD